MSRRTPDLMRAAVVDRPAYSVEAADLPAPVLQEFLDEVAAGRATIPIGRTYTLDRIVQAHHDLEAGSLGGKGVVII